MNVQELIDHLMKVPNKEADVVMFDGPSYYTPCRVYIWENEDRLKDSVIID